MKTNVYILEGLDCANCAAKLEQKINSLEGVETASITFATGQLRVTAEDPDQLLDQIIDTAHKMEPDVKIYKKERRRRKSVSQEHEHSHESHEHHEHSHGESCSCGHDHGHEHNHEGHEHHEHSHGESCS